MRRAANVGRVCGSITDCDASGIRLKAVKRNTSRSVALMWSFLEGGNNMRRKADFKGHDPRQVDLLAVVALLVLIVAGWRYFDDSTALPQSTTAFIVPSQTVHW
jgi:hypothetical protein